jgi:hypothetical protein
MPDGTLPDLSNEGTDIEAWWAVRHRPSLRYALNPAAPHIRELGIDPAHPSCVLIPYSANDTQLMTTGPVEIELKITLASGLVLKPRFHPAAITETFFDS